MLKKITCKLLKLSCKLFGHKKIVFITTKKTHCVCGRCLEHLFTKNTEHSLKGHQVNLIIVDEVADYGKLIQLSTPKSKNSLYDEFKGDDEE